MGRMVSSNGADEVALERSYSVAPPVDVVTAEGLLREAKRILDQLGLVFFSDKAHALAQSGTTVLSVG